MKLVTFISSAGQPAVGSVEAERVIDLQVAHRQLYGRESPSLASMLGLIDAGDAGLELCRGLESDKWLKDGDVVEAEVEKIGVLRNRVVRRRR